MSNLHLQAYVFSEQGDQTLIKMGGPGDPAFQSVYVAIEFYVQNNFKATTVHPHRLFWPGLQIRLVLSHYTEIGQQML